MAGGCCKSRPPPSFRGSRMMTSLQSPERYGAICGAGACFRVKRMVGAGGQCLSIDWTQHRRHHALPIAAAPTRGVSVSVRPSRAHGRRPRADRLSSRRDALGRSIGRDRDMSAEVVNLLRRFKAAGRLSFFHRANAVRQDLRREVSNQLQAAPFAPAFHEQNHATESVGNVQDHVGAVRNVEC